MKGSVKVAKSHVHLGLENLINITITITINLEQGKHVRGRKESNRRRNGVYDICKVKAIVLS